ncbi:MAG TPA: hypothetical protein VGL46_04395 [Pseudonocardiaceae bacterium]|jgi:hypothetical protein
MVIVVLAALFVAGFLAVGGAFVFAFSRRKINRSYSVRMAVFVVVLTFVLATFGFIVAGRMFFFHSTRNASSSATVQVVFTSQTYDLQSGLFSLEGSVRGLGSGQELWVVFRDSQSDRLFPAQAPCAVLPDNRFSCLRIPTGALNPSKPNVKGFMVAAAPRAAAAIFRRDASELSPRTVSLYGLPDGATLVSKIAIGS